jgi:hypothetical protein
MMDLVDQAAVVGISDPREQWRYAVAMFDYEHASMAATYQQRSTEAQETATDKRREHQKRGRRQGTQNRKGSVAPVESESTRPQNPSLTPGQQLLQDLRQDGAEFV